MRETRAILLVAGMLLSLCTFAQVSSDFSATPLSGCSPQVVQFTDLSSGNPTTWLWNFGNGNTSTLQNPAASYVTPGTYNISLTVSDGASSDTRTRLAYITIFSNPTANFGASATSGCVPFPVSFSDLSLQGSGAINSWLWDFGDGNNSTLKNPTHVYTTSGSFTVKLVVTDINGCQHTYSVSNYMTIYPSSNAGLSFSANPLSACNPPLNVTFANSSTGAGLTYQWLFGDGGTSTQANPSYTYNASGTYNVTLVSSNANGCKDTLVKTNYIAVSGNQTVDFAASKQQVCENEPLTFTDLSAPVPVSWYWDFGDGSSSTVQNPSHAWALQGNYTVKLVTTYPGSCSDSVVKNNYITVLPLPDASFTTNDTAACTVPLNTTFTDNSVNAVSWQWNFGDGNTSTQQNPLHSYTNSGLYDVTLVATNAAGCSDTLQRTDYIRIVEPVSGFTVDFMEGCIPLSVQYTDTSVSNEAITGWYWDFGDGSTSTQQNPLHVYTTESKFTVTLVITNSAGCKDTITKTDYVKAGFKPTPDFVATPRVVCAWEYVYFTDLSTHANGWFWEFGDGGTDTVQNPQYQYRDTGFFDVRLIANFNGCRDTILFPDYIYVSPPVALLTVDLNCDTPFVAVFHDRSIAPDQWDWDFGDGTTSVNPTDTVHSYPGRGSYTTTLIVTNTTTGCKDTATLTVNLTDPLASFSATPLSGCAPLDVSFADNSTDAVSWHWYFGDGDTSSLRNPVHTYPDTGTFDVALIVTDDKGCTDSVLYDDYIKVGEITAAFQADTLYGCTPLTVVFSDQSLPSTGISSWQWDFGDGTTSTEQNPTHVYAQSDTTTIMLVITSVGGCTDTVYRSDIIPLTTLPSSSFSVSDHYTCQNTAVIFTGLTSGAGWSYLWDFGDGGTDTTMNAFHVYTQNGDYIVLRTVTNPNGCSTSTSDTIHIEDMVANFYGNPTFASCPPLLVNFFDSSSYATVQWDWDFGDGTGSNLKNPNHLYTSTGSFDVSLIVSSSAGCRDTIVKQMYINISGPDGSFTYSPKNGCPPLTVNFNGNGTNVTNYTWDFGDGNLGTGSTTTHTYVAAGVFYPLLIVSDTAGCTKAIQPPDSIVVTPLAVDAGSDTTICLGQNVTLVGNGAGTQQLWSPSTWLNDSTLLNPVTAPSQTITYYLKTMSGQCYSIDSVTVFVDTVIPLVAFLAPGVCLHDSSFFTDQSSVSQGTLTAWEWSFGNGATSSIQNPAVLYTVADTFDVVLTVSASNGCKATFSKPVEVYPWPLAQFSPTDACANTSNSFSDQSAVVSGSVTGWQWEFGDGATSTQQNPAHAYADTGSYVVSLIALSDHGCRDTITDTVIVYPLPVARFVSDTSVGCEFLPLQFTDSSYAINSTIVQWNWYFGNGDTSGVPNPSYVYAAPGTYDVALKVTTDKGCTDSLSLSAMVQVSAAPVAGFMFDPPEVSTFTPLIKFTDLSSGMISWLWHFGDGDTSLVQNPLHNYADTGRFTILLTVYNADGCPDTATGAVRIKPEFAFYIPNAFTPNNDGKNEGFMGSGIGVKKLTMYIYDRWGNMIYKSEDINTPWDGKVQGSFESAQIDVYEYLFIVEDVFDAVHHYVGHVTLMR